jgi:carbon monoxide dehydrogenase subunit G
MTEINASREIPAPLDRVWNIVSDVDSEPRYWRDLHAVYNISRNGNVIEREVTVGFRNLKGRQIVELHPKKSIEVTLTEGPMTGNRIITLIPSGDETATKVSVSWDVKLSGIPLLFRSVVRERIAEGTEEALDRIARAVQ